jgi:putative glutamine amidotransferase
MKPVIGITVVPESDFANDRSMGILKLNWNYAQMVADAGGVPILITPMTDVSVVAEMIDGWLIPGGDDMDACHFGQENHPKSVLQDPSRWAMESALYDVLPADFPILGICYGAQFLNVKRGGTLIQHVPDVVAHEEHSGGTMQDYAVDSGSRLETFSGAKSITGRSYHHQALDEVGKDLSVVAKANDGIIEAIEDPSQPFFVGVQWHPERTPLDTATLNLFKAFVNASADRKSIK